MRNEGKEQESESFVNNIMSLRQGCDNKGEDAGRPHQNLKRVFSAACLGKEYVQTERKRTLIVCGL